MTDANSRDATVQMKGSAGDPLAGVKPFVQKIYAMTVDPATAHIVTWSPDGSALSVLDVEPFVSTLLPTYFKHSNLSSFVRQLNTYGFSKMDATSWDFKNPDFHRDHPERLRFIERKNSHPNRTSGGGGGSGIDSEMLDALAPLQPVRITPSSGEPAADEASSASTDVEMEAMVRRVGELDRQVKAAQAQQASTRVSIDKIMQLIQTVCLDSASGGGMAHNKRMRIGGGVGIDLEAADKLPVPAASASAFVLPGTLAGGAHHHDAATPMTPSPRLSVESPTPTLDPLEALDLEPLPPPLVPSSMATGLSFGAQNEMDLWMAPTPLQATC